MQDYWGRERYFFPRKKASIILVWTVRTTPLFLLFPPHTDRLSEPARRLSAAHSHRRPPATGHNARIHSPQPSEIHPLRPSFKGSSPGGIVPCRCPNPTPPCHRINSFADNLLKSTLIFCGLPTVTNHFHVTAKANDIFSEKIDKAIKYCLFCLTNHSYRNKYELVLWLHPLSLKH